MNYYLDGYEGSCDLPVEHNGGSVKLRFTRSARRHRIGRAHAMYVINEFEPMVTTNARGEAEYLWVGADDRGVMLEIAAVVVEDDVLLILHVMPWQYRRN